MGKVVRRLIGILGVGGYSPLATMINFEVSHFNTCDPSGSARSYLYPCDAAGRS